MSTTLTRTQAVALGVLVLAALAAGGAGLAAVGGRQGLFTPATELTVGFPDVHDVTPGTPVRVRGVDAGQVVAVEYPDADGPAAAVTLRLRVDAKFRLRLFADAVATVQTTGLLGSKVVSISPGTPAAGPLVGDRLSAGKAVDAAAAAEKLAAVADEAEKLLKDVRTGNGTLAKLVQDDGLYHDLRGLTKKAETAVGKVEQEATGVRELVADGRETLRSVRQGTDAIQRMPGVRSYVEDPVAVLVRPDCRREDRAFLAADLFEPGTAILTPGGKTHLAATAEWLKSFPDDRAEVAVAAKCDPADPAITAAGAGPLTKKQAETAVAFLKAAGAHKIGWWSRRTVTAVGLGAAASPAATKDPLPPAYLHLLVFTPTP